VSEPGLQSFISGSLIVGSEWKEDTERRFYYKMDAVWILKMGTANVAFRLSETLSRSLIHTHKHTQREREIRHLDISWHFGKITCSPGTLDY